MANYKAWSEDEIEFIKQNRYALSAAEIAAKLNRSAVSVQSKLKSMGLTYGKGKKSSKELALLQWQVVMTARKLCGMDIIPLHVWSKYWSEDETDEVNTDV